MFSPDGEQIAFISKRNGDFDVHLMTADGSDQHALFPRGGHEYEPTWSPDGKLVACTARIRHLCCIQISRRDGIDSYYLACGPATGIHSISFSPDGKKLAAAYRKYGVTGLMAVDLDAEVDSQQEDWRGKNVHFLRTTKLVKPRGGNWYASGENSPRAVGRVFSGVSFLPDGSKLLYCSDEAPGHQFQLYTIPVAGGEPQPIDVPTPSPAVTVCGTR